MKTYIKLVLVLLAMLLVPSLDAQAAEVQAQDITATTVISGTGFGSLDFLKDGNIDSYRTGDAGCSITLENPQGIASIYLYFDLEYGEYSITDNDTGAQITAGSHNILHEFVDLQAGFGKVPISVTLYFEAGGVRLSEIYSFTQGQTPSYVQKWTPPLEGGADIVLFSSHSDDDQLFFAGLVPTYAGARECRVQVVLMTNHREGPFATYGRTHEVLNGLWATGLTAYPVFGPFVDYRLDDIQSMYQYYANMGVSRDTIQGFVVEQLRRFKPLVAIGHDLGGEYGHGMHKIYAEMVANGVTLAEDPGVYPASAEKYGTWQTQKTYLHLYSDNPIVLNYDIPLERFGGLTAFQASQKLGYPCHHSQKWTWFTQWLNGNNAQITSPTQIEDYNPAHFGLYRSTVGPDVEKNDFLENIVTYAQQDANAALEVDGKILSLGPVTLESQAAIEAARSAYEALTSERKALVANLEILEAAEAALATLQQQYQNDIAAAQTVASQIAALGEITLEKETAIQSAQAAYDQLTRAQKNMVENADVLATAQEKLAQLQQQAVQEAELARKKTQLTYGLVGLGILVLVLALVLLSARPRRRKHRRKKR